MAGAIVAVTADNVIGLDGKLPWHHSADLRRFKRVTLGSAIVMGRKTWDSIGRRALPGRRNLVVSRSPVADAEGFTSVEAALVAAGEPCWVIGGGEIYRAALPYLDVIDITVVPETVDDERAVRFPDVDAAEWRVAAESTSADDPRLVHRRLERIGPPRPLPVRDAATRSL